jgi:hypothetical protein
MNIAEKNRIFLTKLRNLSEKKKKIILWTIIIILGLTMGFFWTRGVMRNLSKIGESAKSIKFPSIDINMPQSDILQTTTPSDIK